MCLVLENEDVKNEVAENDIIVYKYLYKRGEKYVTPYQFFTMKLGKLYMSRLKKWSNQIENGLHSFTNFDDCKTAALQDKDDVGETIICEFIIPKDAKFYRGKFGLQYSNKVSSFASSRIIFNKEIEII